MSELNYPTEEALRKLTDSQVDNNTFHNFMEIAKSLWQWEDYFSREGDTYELHTGGWSGNEDVIGALVQNQLFWLMYWKQSRVGGHYIFSCSREWDKTYQLRADLARRDDLIKRLVEDGEGLERCILTMDEPCCDMPGTTHSIACPITLHRALMKEVEG